MEKGVVLICILSFNIALGGTQSGATPTQTPDLEPNTWHNETCEDLCGCVEGIMRGLSAAQICMEVKGYPCHLMKQLTRAAPPKNCSVTIGGNWFECDQRNTDCAEEVDVDDEANCTESSAYENVAANIAYLGCESTVGKNTSVTCVLSRDRNAVGQCVNNAKCLYKRERVSCLKNWVSFKRHCLSPINGIVEPNVLDQRTWYGAQGYCDRRWESSLLSLPSFSENIFQELKQRGIFAPDEKVWTGLFRDNDTSTFQWEDGTPITKSKANRPWAYGHPKPGLNYVYVLNNKLHTADSSQRNRYSCKMKVSKSLKCRQPSPTTQVHPTTMSDDAVGTTQLSTKPKDSAAALREDFTKVREDISNYLKTLTNNTDILDDIDTIIFSDTSDESAQDQTTKIMESMDSVVEGLAESIVGPAEPLVISTPDIVLKVLTLCLDCDDGGSLGGQLGNQSFSLSLPDSVKAAGATLALSTARLLHEKLPVTIDNEDAGQATQKKIGSLVSTIGLRRWDGEEITLTKDEPLQLTFSKLQTFPNYNATCRYWKVTEGNDVQVWSSEGCTVAVSNDTHTVCNITHLTSFAVIMQISHSEEPLPKSLEYLTWAGCALSITCLAILLIIFLTQRMYRADRNIIHMNLAVALMSAQLIFVFGIDRNDNPGVCKSVGILVHFFLLATFFWMLNEGIFLLSKTTSAKTRWLRLPTYFTLGWVFPLVIVGVTMAASFDSYDTKERCWLTVHDGGIWAFVGPAAAVILINVFVLVHVIRVFLSLKTNMNKKKVERIRIALRAILLTLPLLGCTWLIGMLSFNSDTHAFAFIFVILNSLQGVFIFILYCLLNDEIKKGLRKRLALLQSLSGRTTHTRGSRTTSGSNNLNRLSKTMQPEREAAKL